MVGMLPPPGLLGSFSVVSFITLLSKISGLAQTFFLSHVLGAGSVADAYAVAFRLPNLFRRFTAENAMLDALLPTLEEAEKQGGQETVEALAAKFLGTLLALMLLVVVLALLFMGPLAALLTLGRPSLQAELTAFLGRITFPYLALVSLTAGFSGLLNQRNRMALGASVSIFWNLSFMAFAWTTLRVLERSSSVPEETVAVVCALAVLAGGSVQLLVLLPAIRREGFSFSFGFHFRDQWVLKVFKRMGPGVLVGGLHPINAMVSTMLASNLPNGAQVVLFNSNMMGEMVLGVTGMALVTAARKPLNQQAENLNWVAFNHTLAQTVSASALLILPASVGIAVLSRPICALLFRTGAYGAAASDWTAYTLIFQALGLLFVATHRIGTTALSALKDFRGAAILAGASILLNIALSLALLGPLGTGGLALANGLSALAGLTGVLFRLYPRVPDMRIWPLLEGVGLVALACIPMGLLAWSGMAWFGMATPHGLTRMALTLRLLPLIALCALIYALLVVRFGHPEARQLAERLRRMTPPTDQSGGNSVA